jgi:hypothetical protein
LQKKIIRPTKTPISCDLYGQIFAYTTDFNQSKPQVINEVIQTTQQIDYNGFQRRHLKCSFLRSKFAETSDFFAVKTNKHEKILLIAFLGLGFFAANTGSRYGKTDA